MGGLGEGANEDVKVGHLVKIMKDLETWTSSSKEEVKVAS